jgi:hypothetical protein
MSESQNTLPIRPKALNELFRPPDETSSSEQESNASKYNFRMWWNSIQSIEKEDYEVSDSHRDAPTCMVGHSTTCQAHTSCGSTTSRSPGKTPKSNTPSTQTFTK